MTHPHRPREVSSRPLLALLLCAVAVTAVPMVAGLVQTGRLARLVLDAEVSRWRDEVNDALRGDHAPDARALAALEARAHERGLRYIALHDADGHVLAEAGASVTLPSAECHGAGGTMYTRVRGRVRACGGPVRLTRARETPTRPMPGGPIFPAVSGLFGAAPMMEDVPVRYLPTTRFEFEPGATVALARARAGLVTAGLATLLAMVTLGAFAAKLLDERDEITHKLAQARHMASLGEMSAVLAHEIRNPLASLKGHAQLLAERLAGDARVAPRVDRIVGDATRLERLVDELLRFARSGDLDRKPVQSAHWVRGVVATLDLPGVHVLIDNPPAQVTLDPVRMGEALANVIRNGLEASGGHGPVTVRVARDDDDGALVVEVRDQGPGITPGDEERVFDPFLSRKVRGTGLGLAIVRRTIALHGGTVTARNHRDGGALFRMVLPAG